MPNKAQYAKKFPAGYAGRKVTLEGKRVFVWPSKSEPQTRIVGRGPVTFPKFLIKRHHPTKEAALADFEDVCNAVLLGTLPPSMDGRPQPGDSRREAKRDEGSV